MSQKSLVKDLADFDVKFESDIMKTKPRRDSNTALKFLWLQRPLLEVKETSPKFFEDLRARFVHTGKVGLGHNFHVGLNR